jgi:spore maturation protein CgeB
VFFGSFIDPEECREKWKEQFPPVIGELIENSAQEALGGKRHFVEIFFSLVNAKKSEGVVETFSLPEALQELELYLKALDRINVLQSITSCKVDVFGNSIHQNTWKNYFAGQSNIFFHPAVAFTEALQIMKQAKIVVNSSVKSVYGAHERVFSGMACGAAVLSSRTTFLEELFVDEKSILFYQPGRYQEINDKVKLYLKDEKKRQVIVEQSADLVKKHHTWDERLKLLLPQVMPVIKSLS